MKRVLVFSPSNKGTIAACTANIIRALKNTASVEVFVMTLYKEKDGIPVFDEGYSIVDKTTDVNSNTSYSSKIREIKRVKKIIKPDITVSTLVSVSTLSVLSGGRDKKIGVFHAPLDQTKNVSMLNYFFCKFSYAFLLKKLDRLYAVSKTTQKDVEKHTGRETQLVYNIHNFEEIETKSCEPLSSEETIIFKKPTVLYVGHLYETKGVRRLLNAFALLSSDCNLVVIGANSQGEVPVVFRDLSSQLKIAERTFFLGYKNNPYKYMKNSSMLVLPSYSEGLPGVMIEALSLNKRVISTNSSIGVWEIMQCYNAYTEDIDEPYENDLGFIVSNNDTNDKCIKQLSDSIEKILNGNDIANVPFDKSRFEGKELVKYFTLDN